jgi:hypothetical protein
MLYKRLKRTLIRQLLTDIIMIDLAQNNHIVQRE